VHALRQPAGTPSSSCGSCPRRRLFALVDLGLPPAPHTPDEGFQLIADLLAHSPSMKIFVLSGQNDAAKRRAMRGALGAWEFVAKPSDPALLKRPARAPPLELPSAEAP